MWADERGVVVDEDDVTGPCNSYSGYWQGLVQNLVLIGQHALQKW
jgi:hypothetical protein